MLAVARRDTSVTTFLVPLSPSFPTLARMSDVTGMVTSMVTFFEPSKTACPASCPPRLMVRPVASFAAETAVPLAARAPTWAAVVA